MLLVHHPSVPSIASPIHDKEPLRDVPSELPVPSTRILSLLSDPKYKASYDQCLDLGLIKDQRTMTVFEEYLMEKVTVDRYSDFLSDPSNCDSHDSDQTDSGDDGSI